MNTYLTVFFSSEGATPSEVAERLQMLGFEPTQGNYDFVYKWDSKATVKDALWFADKIRATLDGMHVFFKIETI
ncbi:MAG: hypothetical protein J7L61_04385 [Thermoplasmata archaeon]|nr:hypothetical protein [Thermoplasmata archaeon]